jgi:hypothetical protein
MWRNVYGQQYLNKNPGDSKQVNRMEKLSPEGRRVKIIAPITNLCSLQIKISAMPAQVQPDRKANF